ncbi:MAG: hypothetical protein KKA19_05160 [Candidatus Margulisbacteria bacterium]|nr:hypothetical protein [Candidatus Margulisiibacteriota bacterium]
METTPTSGSSTTNITTTSSPAKKEKKIAARQVFFPVFGAGGDPNSAFFIGGIHSRTIGRMKMYNNNKTRTRIELLMYLDAIGTSKLSYQDIASFVQRLKEPEYYGLNLRTYAELELRLNFKALKNPEKPKTTEDNIHDYKFYFTGDYSYNYLSTSFQNMSYQYFSLGLGFKALAFKGVPSIVVYPETKDLGLRFNMELDGTIFNKILGWTSSQRIYLGILLKGDNKFNHIKITEIDGGFKDKHKYYGVKYINNNFLVYIGKKFDSIEELTAKYGRFFNRDSQEEITKITKENEKTIQNLNKKIDDLYKANQELKESMEEMKQLLNAYKENIAKTFQKGLISRSLLPGFISENNKLMTILFDPKTIYDEYLKPQIKSENLEKVLKEKGIILNEFQLTMLKTILKEAEKALEE